jgi:nucleotide-binding universal stress UspA family protein
MSTATITPEGIAVQSGDDVVGLGPILVATDGASASDATIQAAARMATGADAKVVVLTVLEPPVQFAGLDYGIVLPLPEADFTLRHARLDTVRAQIARVACPAIGWDVELREGDPARVIAHTSRELRAQLVIVGLGRHDLLDRLIGTETALHTLRASKAPVLAVSQTFDHLPRRVLVATDFSVASIDAARAALKLFPSISTIFLAHVLPKIDMQPEAFATWVALHGEGLAPAFQRARSELALPPTVTVEDITLEGKAPRELLEYARSAGVDLIVTGSRGAGFLDRLLIGSTATGLIRGAQCAVLAVPARPQSERLIGISENPEEVVPENRWAEELTAFTKRNAGRRTVLEVDDPELGAQAQERNYPLLGVAYDHYDRRVEVMLGDFEGVRRHLTRGIADVHSIDVLRNAEGRDVVLRIAHGRGQTILTLEK